ncbi:helix-turn-helix domain-containing protein [Pseudomonas fluorescens]|uniref:helix-turn-helix transcriptional regulator n=1 Tax=Pseudomonas TaxID=286 RepID=UPI0009EE1ADE|nr:MULTISPECIES: helix-turn-helix domain-containing protein [Pseudomonas]UXV21772.1 helix-turn-helix domain-containing protein [Pseudomonas fluorescens]
MYPNPMGVATHGRRLGLSRQIVNAIETGRHDPSLPLAFKISKVFECRIEAFFEAPKG